MGACCEEGGAAGGSGGTHASAMRLSGARARTKLLVRSEDLPSAANQWGVKAGVELLYAELQRYAIQRRAGAVALTLRG